MLKSLGQWNISTSKTARLVQAPLTVETAGTAPAASNGGQGEQTATRTEDVLVEEYENWKLLRSSNSRFGKTVKCIEKKN